MTHATTSNHSGTYRTEIQVSGHAIVADEPASLGGSNAGPAPFDLLLASLGACTSITLRMYADRKGWPMGALAIDLRTVKGADVLRIERILSPEGLDEAQRARIADVAERTPVTLALKSGMAIHTILA